MRVAVTADAHGPRVAGLRDEAQALARRLDLPFTDATVASEYPLILTFTPERLELREAATGSGPISAEFREGKQSPLLRRATLAGKAGVSTIVDATAGLGADAFVLAEAGCHVHLVERSAIVGALLANGIERARSQPATQEAASRMTLHVADAALLLPRLAPVDVVYLDPMYPRSGREGGKAKEMRILRELVGADADAPALLAAARAAAERRVVVKRPLRAEYLGGEKPSGSLRGTVVRYDLYGPLPARRVSVDVEGARERTR